MQSECARARTHTLAWPTSVAVQGRLRGQPAPRPAVRSLRTLPACPHACLHARPHARSHACLPARTPVHPAAPRCARARASARRLQALRALTAPLHAAITATVHALQQPGASWAALARTHGPPLAAHLRRYELLLQQAWLRGEGQPGEDEGQGGQRPASTGGEGAWQAVLACLSLSPACRASLACLGCSAPGGPAPSQPWVASPLALLSPPSRLPTSSLPALLPCTGPLQALVAWPTPSCTTCGLAWSSWCSSSAAGQWCSRSAGA